MNKTWTPSPTREIIDIVDQSSGRITKALVVATDPEGNLIVVDVKDLKKDGTRDGRNRHDQTYLGWNAFRVDPSREEKANAVRAEIAALDKLADEARTRLYAIYENDRKPGERDPS